MKHIADMQGVVQALLVMSRFLEAIQTFEKMVGECQRFYELVQLEQKLLPLFPHSLLHTQPKLALLAAQVWCGAREPRRLLEALEPLASLSETLAATKVYLGWARLHTGQAEQTLALLPETQLLDKHHQGLCWRFRAEAKFKLSDPTWRQDMQQAKQLLAGLALGRCLLEEGTLLSLQRQLGRARGIWAEATVALSPDPYYCAWANYNIGIALQFSQPGQAERYFLEAEHLSSLKAGRAFYARALCGLAAIRRQLGDWQRALDTYRRASKELGDPSDKLEALWGQAYMLRLMGQHERALHVLREGEQLKLPNERWIQADIAAVKLMLGDGQGCREALGQAGDLGERSGMLVRLIELELQRRNGGEVSEPIDLPLESPWLPFETVCFPELFGALGLAEVNQRLPPVVGVQQVVVSAVGALKVSVNGRPLELPQKVGELLVRLLESGGGEATETLMDDLYPQHGHGQERKARQALWELGDRLRAALGWEASLESEALLYRLDGTAVWAYDMAKLPPSSWGNFLRGSTADWVEEKRRASS